MLKKLGIIAFVAFAYVNIAQPVFAGQVVDQGTKPWNVSFAGDTSLSTDVCVPTIVSTTVPTTALKNRRVIEIQNNGPNPINCTGDADVLTTVAPMSHVIPGGINASWIVPITDKVQMRCVSLTADQASATGCTNVTEIR